jgi:hypothetical protein
MPTKGVACCGKIYGRFHLCEHDPAAPETVRPILEGVRDEPQGGSPEQIFSELLSSQMHSEPVADARRNGWSAPSRLRGRDGRTAAAGTAEVLARCRGGNTNPSAPACGNGG